MVCIDMNKVNPIGCSCEVTLGFDLTLDEFKLTRISGVNHSVTARSRGGRSSRYTSARSRIGEGGAGNVWPG